MHPELGPTFTASTMCPESGAESPPLFMDDWKLCKNDLLRVSYQSQVNLTPFAIGHSARLYCACNNSDDGQVDASILAQFDLKCHSSTAASGPFLYSKRPVHACPRRGIAQTSCSRCSGIHMGLTHQLCRRGSNQGCKLTELVAGGSTSSPSSITIAGHQTPHVPELHPLFANP